MFDRKSRRTDSPVVLMERCEERRLMSLTIDVRIVGGAKTADVVAVGQIVRMEVFATVTGSNTDGTVEGLQMVIGSFLSKNVNGGAAKGKLSAVRTAPFTGLASSDGVSADLDRDGDRDVGSNDGSTSDGHFGARSSSLTTNGRLVTRGQKFKIADLKFTTQILLAGGTTEINFRQRNPSAGQRIGANWVQDGAGRHHPDYGTLRINSPVILRRAASARALSFSTTPIFGGARREQAPRGGSDAIDRILEQTA
ncbi:MAG: hypothetical protein ACREJC_06225 [Tepidisphaeraceae bacterium]